MCLATNFELQGDSQLATGSESSSCTLASKERRNAGSSWRPLMGTAGSQVTDETYIPSVDDLQKIRE